MRIEVISAPVSALLGYEVDMEKQKGFTLIELLVVIAIIAILMGIVRPMLSASASKSREFECESHLKQIGMAMQSYSQDYGRFPSKLVDIDPILQNMSLLDCPGTSNSYYYAKPISNLTRDEIIVSCVNLDKLPKRLPHRSGTCYLTLTASGHVKRVISK